MLNLQVEEDEHEAGPGRVLKRPRYSPMPGPVAAVGAQLGQDEPSSSHCSDPAGEQLDSCSWSSPSRSLTAGPAGTQLETVSRLQAQLVEREAELQLQRDQAETFLRELQETVGTHAHTCSYNYISPVFSPSDTCIQVMCPVCLSIPRQPPVPCCQNGHVICAKCKERVEVVSLQTPLTPNRTNHVPRVRCAPPAG